MNPTQDFIDAYERLSEISPTGAQMLAHALASSPHDNDMRQHLISLSRDRIDQDEKEAR